MRVLDPTFLSEKNKETNQPIKLFTIFDYDGIGGDLNYAEAKENIVYDSITYYKFAINFERISENSTGEIDTIRISMGNVSRLIQAYLEDYDLRGKKVSIKMVWADQLADTDAYIEDIYYIDSYGLSQQDAEFILTSKMDILSVEIPTRIYNRNYCSWNFKSTECGYGGGEIVCDKTLSRCRVLANQLRFGGFPSVPSRRVVVS